MKRCYSVVIDNFTDAKLSDSYPLIGHDVVGKTDMATIRGRYPSRPKAMKAAIEIACLAAHVFGKHAIEERPSIGTTEI